MATPLAFLIASLVSAVIVVVSPFMGQLQSYLRRTLSTDQYVWLFGGGVLAAVGAAFLVAVLRIHERRAARVALLVAALAVGGGYLQWTATPWREVNAVERVHFVEYGLIAFLFYRAWRSAGDLSMVVLPLLSAFMVGTFDEWLQWFIPVRVGEAHDVFLNLVSISCGLMFAIALQPPASFSLGLTPQMRRQCGAVAAMVWLVFATFISQVHLGHQVTADGLAPFLSHYTKHQLDALQADRAATWKTAPPRVLRRLSREDQYLDEGLWHVRRRNLTDGIEAWHENLILERFFAPVLDTPTYASPGGNRWSAEQRTNMAASIRATAPFVSTANPYPIVAWPKRMFWPVVLTAALLLLVLAFAAARPAPRTDR